jgi:hypothetical protein
MNDMESLGGLMNKFFTRYLNRSGLTGVAVMVSVGVIDLFDFVKELRLEKPFFRGSICSIDASGSPLSRSYNG